MIKIFKKRGGGKTMDLIDKSAETGAYIVCLNQNEASRIAAIAQEKNKDIPFPLTFEEFDEHQYHGKGVKGFLIDNLDMFIAWKSHLVIGFSITKPEENEEE